MDFLRKYLQSDKKSICSLLCDQKSKFGRLDAPGDTKHVGWNAALLAEQILTGQILFW
jgi:hypothetical protein